MEAFRPAFPIVDGIEFADDDVPLIKELVELYESVGWSRYSDDPDGLARAVDRSTYVVTARDDDGELIGLARCLSDDVSIMYLQDVLVYPDRQRRGLGRALVGACLDRFNHVRQKVLLTDNEPGQIAFYEHLGYQNLRDVQPVMNTFVRFDH
ncbi:MAG: GNAT family N-acetyltransferase [Actinomycetota bacterium]